MKGISAEVITAFEDPALENLLGIDGDVEGTIESQDNKVTVGPNGRVQAGIKAREVVLLGQVKGNVEAADKVDIRKDARLEGDIVSSRISIEDLVAMAARDAA